MDNFAGDNVRKTLCVLSVSPYQQDVLDEWFARWDGRITREHIDMVPNGILGALEFWNVDGPPQAFSELPREVFAGSYRAALSGLVPDDVDLS